jgi:4-hydroxy-tetrahydrodipicolinate synthase
MTHLAFKAPRPGSQLALGRSVTAMVTPFRDGEVDGACLVRLCERQIARGTTALVVCGSTGEAPALGPGGAGQGGPPRHRRGGWPRAGGRWLQRGGHRGGSGPCAFRCTVRGGCAALPPYVKPTQEGIFSDVQAVAHASDLPIIL